MHGHKNVYRSYDTWKFAFLIYLFIFFFGGGGRGSHGTRFSLQIIAARLF